MLIKIDVAQPVVAWLEDQGTAHYSNSSEVAGRIIVAAWEQAKAASDAAWEQAEAEAEAAPKATKTKKAEGGDDGGG